MKAIGIRHAAIVASDMEKVLPFYRDLLGMQIWADFKDDSEYVQAVTGVKGAHIWTVNLKTVDGATIQLKQYLSHPQSAPPPKRSCDTGLNHLAIQVDDIDAIYAKLQACGTTFYTPPMVSSQGIAKVAICRDPEGVLIELVEMLPQKKP